MNLLLLDSYTLLYMHSKENMFTSQLLCQYMKTRVKLGIWWWAIDKGNCIKESEVTIFVVSMMVSEPM